MMKIFERILLARLMPIIGQQRLIPDEQFVFRQKIGIRKIDSIVNEATNALENGMFCSAGFRPRME